MNRTKLIIFTGFAVCIGCGPRSDRLPISGTVTLDGAPLDTGSIRFTSIGTDNVSATGAMIQNGQFNIAAAKGLSPGSYHVQISAPDNSAPAVTVRGPHGEPGIPTQPERIPPEYNVESTKSIEVTADGDNHFEFMIDSR
jgi:hypothetical protein